MKSLYVLFSSFSPLFCLCTRAWMYVRLGPRERAQHGKLEEDSSDADAGYSVCQAQPQGRDRERSFEVREGGGKGSF